MQIRILMGVALACIAGGASSQAWEVFDMNNTSMPNNTVKALAVAPGGDVWVGTELGLCRYDNVAWQVFQTGSSGLPDNDVRALAVDDTGAVWVGTLNGLARYHDGTWTVYQTGTSGMPENYVRSLAIDPQGGVWVGTVGGLAWFDGGSTWHVYNDTPGSHNGLVLPGNNIAALHARPDGLLCIGTVNAGFTYLNDTSVTVYTTFANGLPDNTALGVATDSQGWRWLACPAGALLHHAGDFIGGAWLQYSTLNSMIPSNSLTCITIDGQDRRIVGNLISGLTIFQGVNSFSTYTAQNSDLPSNEVTAVALDGEGRVWVGTTNGGAARFAYAVGEEEFSLYGGISVFPNPTDGGVIVQVPQEWAQARYAVLDATGRMVGQGRLQGATARVELEALEPGTYAIDLRTAEGARIQALRVLRR